MLTVVGAIAAVVVVVSTDGAAAPIAAEGVQSVAAILGTIPDSPQEPADISGATVQAVIHSMCENIKKLHQRIDEQEEYLRQALISLRCAVQKLLAPGEIGPKMLVEPPGEFTGLAKAGVGTLRTTFFDR